MSVPELAHFAIPRDAGHYLSLRNAVEDNWSSLAALCKQQYVTRDELSSPEPVRCSWALLERALRRPDL